MVSNFITSIHHLRISSEYMDDIVRQHPGSRAAVMFEGYSKKIKWILRDIYTNPHFTDPIREGMKKEIESDPLTYRAIMERISLLAPAQRDMLEFVVNDMIDGKQIKIQVDE
jgi:hypothetical protein